MIAIRVRPDNAGLALVGMVYQQYGDVEKAQVAYCGFGATEAPAANNLRTSTPRKVGTKKRHSSSLRLPGKSLQEPNIADTLGWILYKRGVYQRALGLLTESAGKLRKRVVHYGMVHSQLGHIEEARDALTRP